MPSQALKVTDIMRRKVLAVDSASDAYEAGKLILEEQGGYVLVENNRTVIGIITWRNYVEGILKWRITPSEIRVRHIMSSPVHMIDSEATVENIVALMSSEKISRVPVLEEEKIIGIVFARDIARLVVSRRNPEEIEKGGGAENLSDIMPLLGIP